MGYVLYSGGFFWSIIYVVLFFVLFNRTNKLSKRLDDLTKKLDGSKASTFNERVNEVTQTIQQTKPSGSQDFNNNVVQNIVTVNPEFEKYSNFESPIEKWLKENTLLKIGVLLVLLGFGWFVSYAFIHDWIGPVGRIALGFITGSFLAIFGTFRLPKSEVQGSLFTLLGSALIIITALAGQYYYKFFGETSILLIIFLVSVYTSITAYAWSNKKIAIYSLIIALSAPYLSHSSNLDGTVVYLYLAVISIGTIWLSAKKQWHEIITVGITGVFLYSIPYLGFLGKVSDPSKYTILFLSFGVSLIYLSISIWSLYKRGEEAGKDNLYLTVLNSAIILGSITAIIPTVYQSITIALWIVIYAISGYITFTISGKEKLMYIHALSSIVFLGVATSIELSGQTLVIALAIESLIITLATYVITNNYKSTESISVLAILPAIMSIGSIYSSKWNHGIIHSDFAVLFLMLVITVFLGMFLKSLVQNKEGETIYPAYLITSSVYFFILVWLINHFIFINTVDTGVFVSLFIYCISGLYTYFTGKFRDIKILRNYGSVILICLVVRLVIVDVWNMDIVLRVVTFIVIGGMFIGTAFISNKNK